MTVDYYEILAQLPDEALLEVPVIPFKHLYSGKVREIYEVDADTLLIIATDRLSAYDVIMREGIPGKGIILNQLSLRWFERIKDLAPTHLVDGYEERLRELLSDSPDLVGRAMLVMRLEPLPIEAIVRGYLTGGAMSAYQSSGDVQGHVLASGLVEGSPLEDPIFTPSTKAEVGDHDLPITCAEALKLLGREAYEVVEHHSIALFERGTAVARESGLILADTKFEFGRTREGEIRVMDEVLTPDSSRYWPADSYAPGRAQQAFDKQFIRDFLVASGWNKQPPPPVIPRKVLMRTREPTYKLSKLLSLASQSVGSSLASFRNSRLRCQSG